MWEREANRCKSSQRHPTQSEQFSYIFAQQIAKVQKCPFMHVEDGSQLSLPPARKPLTSQHLRCASSRPAEFNITYRQDVLTLCMDTNKLNSVAAHHAAHAHTWSMRPKGLWRNLDRANLPPACLPARGRQSAFSVQCLSTTDKADRFRPLYFSQLESGGRPRFILLMCDDCELHRASPDFSIGISVAPAELLSSDQTLIKSERAKSHFQPSLHIGRPWGIIGAAQPVCASSPFLTQNCSSRLQKTLMTRHRLLFTFTPVSKWWFYRSHSLMSHLFIVMWGLNLNVNVHVY